MMMLSISGNNDGIYMSYMFPRMASVLTLPCRPCSGPRQLKFGNFQLVVTILGVLEMARLHLRHYPIFSTGICALVTFTCNSTTHQLVVLPHRKSSTNKQIKSEANKEAAERKANWSVAANTHHKNQGGAADTEEKAARIPTKYSPRLK